MFCHHCQANLPDDVHFCIKCGKPQSAGAVVPTESIPTEQEAPLAGSLRQALEEQWTRQQAVLTKLRTEVDLKFMSQFAELSRQQAELDKRLKLLEPKAQPSIDLPRRLALTILIVLSLAIVGLFWVLYKLVVFLPTSSFDAISIISTLLTLIGSLYLAYDLLGRHHGPLLWLTHTITCGLAAIIMIEPILLFLVWIKADIIALAFIMAEGSLGAAIGIVIGILAILLSRPFFTQKLSFWINNWCCSLDFVLHPSRRF